MTSTLRGAVMGKITAQAVKTSVHSGLGSGIVPDMFRVLTNRLKAIEDPKSGQMIEELNSTIPGKFYMDAEKIVSIKGNEVIKEHNFYDGVEPLTNNIFELYLNNNFRSMMTVTGIDGLPRCNSAGNVLNNTLSLNFSIRLSPFMDPVEAGKIVYKKLSENVPYNCKVDVDIKMALNGFYAPIFPEHIEEIIKECSNEVFNKDPLFMHCGGSIPFMGMLKEKFSSSYFMVTGILGPNNNAHAGNENINIAYFKKFLVVMTRFLQRIAIVDWMPDMDLTKQRSKSFHNG